MHPVDASHAIPGLGIAIVGRSREPEQASQHDPSRLDFPEADRLLLP